MAVAHGGLTVTVKEDPNVVQPGPFSGGETRTERRTDITVDEDGASMIAMPATTTVRDLVRVMNSIGATPDEVVRPLQCAIFKNDSKSVPAAHTQPMPVTLTGKTLRTKEIIT